MKNIGFLLLALTIAAPAFAQDTAPVNNEHTTGGSTLWLKGGLGFSTVSGDETNDASSRTGLFVGAEFESPISPMFSIQYGLDYVQKGLTAGPLTLVENYLEVPLLLRLNVPVGPVTLSGLAGGYGAWAAARTLKSDLSDDTDDASNSVSAWDAGLRFGVEGAVAITDHLSVMAGVDYDLGLRNVDTSDSGTEHNRTWIASVGVGFKL